MLPAAWWTEIDERTKRGDRTATAELAENVLEGLCSHLACRFPTRRNQDCIYDAATDALMSYMKHPDQYDPSLRGLKGYLEMAAEADLRNILAKEQRRQNREPQESGVELGQIAGKTSSEQALAEDTDVVKGTIEALFQDPVDQQIAILVIDCERSTKRFAAILDIAHLPVSEQRQIVKRHKDRIKKVLQRRGRTQHE